MEDEKEHHHAEATERVDERREERDRRNQATQQIEQVEDEIPHQKSRHQNRSDQCQQRSIFECHGRSMNVAGDSRNSGLLARIGKRGFLITRRFGGESFLKAGWWARSMS
jgi:hypothetical protein